MNSLAVYTSVVDEARLEQRSPGIGPQISIENQPNSEGNLPLHIYIFGSVPTRNVNKAKFCGLKPHLFWWFSKGKSTVRWSPDRHVWFLDENQYSNEYPTDIPWIPFVFHDFHEYFHIIPAVLRDINHIFWWNPLVKLGEIYHFSPRWAITYFDSGKKRKLRAFRAGISCAAGEVGRWAIDLGKDLSYLWLCPTKLAKLVQITSMSLWFMVDISN